jgi:hypothetical protein
MPRTETSSRGSRSCYDTSDEGFSLALAAEFWGSYNRMYNQTAAAREVFTLADLGPQMLSDLFVKGSVTLHTSGTFGKTQTRAVQS